MRTACARLRKSEEAVTPVIATILMVAITVVLAAVLYAFLGGLRPPDLPRYISVTVDSTQNNWTMDVIGIQNGPIPTSDVQVLVRKADLSTGLNVLMSEMDSGAYNNGVRYIASDSSGYVDVGDLFTLDKAIYGTGSEVLFRSVDGAVIYGSYKV
jgi:flagellin-like protein